jgi:hypothetical protein
MKTLRIDESDQSDEKGSLYYLASSRAGFFQVLRPLMPE